MLLSTSSTLKVMISGLSETFVNIYQYDGSIQANRKFKNYNFILINFNIKAGYISFIITEIFSNVTWYYVCVRAEYIFLQKCININFSQPHCNASDVYKLLCDWRHDLLVLPDVRPHDQRKWFMHLNFIQVDFEGSVIRLKTILKTGIYLKSTWRINLGSSY
jgi:hypothetical protein